MRRLKLLFPLLLTIPLLEAACSRALPHVDVAGPAGAETAASHAARVAPVRRTTSFASLPDRGSLVGYPTNRVVRRETASTWHRADVSEEHAMRSIVTGEMTVTAPDGQPIRFRYERHLEHPNGNWTWVGRDGHGEEAIVTFGEKAVFGSIPHQGQELRIATTGGSSWVVEPDPSKQHHPDTGRPDFVVPPELAASLASGEPVMAAATVEGFTATAVATTVDVALGYTTGFAAELGGDSQAVTRLQHLVDITNQAYANSQINAQIRLVRTVPVNYPDATDNNDALGRLTGFDSGSGKVPIDPAFQSLRAARDQYGADLVSLVRRFRTPENKGCGVAWLIGGKQSGIDSSDSPWGYSVVSDDLDRGDLDETDSRTYVCRKETLAHELGHNMGQVHNVEDSDGTPGVHSYSYGYRESSATGFYTIMAYRVPDSSQKAIRHFANPNVLDPATGRPTGVATTSDNARSMTQTMPLVAAFRAATTPVPTPIGDAPLADGQLRDINGDGRADLLWRLGDRTHWAYWTMAGATKLGGVGYSVDPGWRVIATGDFQGDGFLDVVWSNGSAMQMWMGSASGFVGVAMRSYPLGWSIVGVGDVNADGRADLLWRDDASTALSSWLMNGATIIGSAAYAVPSPWRVVGTGRFNADNRLDVVWSDGNSMQMWLGTAQGFVGAAMPAFPAGWALQGIGDFNGDALDDLIWRHSTLGQVAVWTMSGGTRIGGYGFDASPAWVSISVGDHSGDGRVDVVWTDGRNMQMWLSTGGGFTGAAMAGYPTGWETIRR